MAKAWGLHHPFGQVEMAFRTEKAAMQYATFNPLTIHSVDGDRTEFYTVGPIELPAIVQCLTCKEACRESIVTAKDPKKYPYCKMCFYTGVATEHAMKKTMDKLRKGLPNCQVGVDHTGGGCFCVSVVPEDMDANYYYLTGGDFEVDTIGTEGVGCIGRYRDTEDGLEGALIYEGYQGDFGDSELARITVKEAIRLIKADIKRPVPFTEIY